MTIDFWNGPKFVIQYGIKLLEINLFNELIDYKYI